MRRWRGLCARLRDTLEYRRYEIGQLLESSWQALQIARRRVEMFEGGIIKEAENAFRIAQSAYRLGERGLIEVLDTQRIVTRNTGGIVAGTF